LQQKAGHRSGKCPGFSPDELRVAFSIPSGSLFLVNHPVFFGPNLDIQMFWMHESIFGCIYLFQFKFGKFWRNATKQATALYLNFPLLKTPLRFNDESFMFSSKNHF
jgi:hypothetical protein